MYHGSVHSQSSATSDLRRRHTDRRHPRLLGPCRPRNGFDTPRVLDDATYRQAVDAWETARGDVVDKWNYLADKANLEPRIPPALGRAAKIVRSHAPPKLTQDQVDRSIDTLQPLTRNAPSEPSEPR